MDIFDFGGFFDGAGAGAFDGFGGAFGRAAGAAEWSAAGESGLARFMRFLGVAGELGWDAAGVEAAASVFKKLFGAKDFGTTPEGIEHVQKAVLGHGMLAQQLKVNAHKSDGIKCAYESYVASGHSLPSEGVLKDAYRQLAMIFHPDKNGGSKEKEEFFKQVKDAYEHLGKPEVRASYEEALRSNPEGVKGLFSEITGVDWEKFHDFSFEKLKLEGPYIPPKPLAGAAKWASELSPANRAGLAFGAVAAVVVGGYVVAKVMDSRAKKKKEERSMLAQDETQPVPHVRRVRGAQTAGAAAGLG